MLIFNRVQINISPVFEQKLICQFFFPLSPSFLFSSLFTCHPQSKLQAHRVLSWLSFRSFHSLPRFLVCGVCVGVVVKWLKTVSEVRVTYLLLTYFICHSPSSVPTYWLLCGTVNCTVPTDWLYLTVGYVFCADCLVWYPVRSAHGPRPLSFHSFSAKFLLFFPTWIVLNHETIADRL